MRSLTCMGFALLFFTQLNLSGFAQPGFIKTVAGNGMWGSGGDGGPAISAGLREPSGVAIDTAGNLYIADYMNGRVRKVTREGIISTIAGGGNSLEEGIPATSARLSITESVAVDATGTIYIADTGNHRIRKLTSAGLITTIAGNGTKGFSGDDGPATSAQLYYPSGVAVDASGNVFISDTSNSRVRKVTPAGVITTFAGNGIPGSGGDGGAATSAQLLIPESLAIDTAGNVYIAVFDGIRKVNPAGLISRVAGTETEGFSGDGGPALAAQLHEARGVAIDTAGNLYVGDSGNNRIRKVTPAGLISTIAGNGTSDYGGDNAPAISAKLNVPYGVAFDAAGNLYIACKGDNRIRRIEAAHVSATFFPLVVVGGGYSARFTITNAGAAAASGKLILVDQHGRPLALRGTLSDPSGASQSADGSSFDIALPAGGTAFLSVPDPGAGSPSLVGYAQVQSMGGYLSAEETLEYSAGGKTYYLGGVPYSQPLQSATIPVDNDADQGRQMAYAIANPGNRTISVKLAVVGQDGNVVNDKIVVSLGPGEQIARYLWQDLALTRFRGSLVLRGQSGASFFALGLLDRQGTYAVVPLTPGKAPSIPD